MSTFIGAGRGWEGGALRVASTGGRVVPSQVLHSRRTRLGTGSTLSVAATLLLMWTLLDLQIIKTLT